MKKYLKILFCLSLVFFIVGCGKVDEKNSDNQEKNETIVQKTPEQKLQEFVNEYKTNVENLSNDYLDVKFEARGKSVVYLYYYDTTFTEEQLGLMKPVLEKNIEQNSEVFNNLLLEIRKTIPEAESVIVEYYNGDKKLISSYDFK